MIWRSYLGRESGGSEQEETVPDYKIIADLYR